jgi:hypothetical protein
MGWLWIEQILKADQEIPCKQRHTAKRIGKRLRAEDFGGGYMVVKDVIWELT